mmetsp:Transcript_13303/g.35674  ORF Transcript_13303/g.35674 Transcript_13303/m.35674 type:complete len:321 (-) Transcript_13303:78-1040(-)
MLLGPRTVLLALSTAAVAELTGNQHFTDEEVLESHRPFLHAWRNHFNKGDAVYCGDAYLPDATMMMKFGPLAAFGKQQANFEDSTIARGRTAITALWRDIIDRLGFQDLRAYEEEGSYAPTALALDDDTVTVGGKFNFGDAVEGRIFSEIWVRDGATWKLRSTMLSIEHADVALLEKHVAAATRKTEELPTSTLVPQTALSSSARQVAAVSAEAGEASAEAKASQSTAKPAAPSLRLAATQRTVEALANATMQDLLSEAPSLTEEEPTIDSPSKGEHSSAGGSIVWMFAVSLVLVLAFYFYKNRRRQQAMTIGGPDTLLG